eukprot:TRINITY_DN1209_c0_g1_i1.p1 TRINITY_DN1209_c0_g1~~TRINITY_DN1209_c0_g1_i1.p1  ORF type:complete len:330 (+),score=61.51 TRINITY_DN1209_c0_g1_i1:54-1043(+)
MVTTAVKKYFILLILPSLVLAVYPGNYALKFDGIDDIVKIGHTETDLDLDLFWTLEAWVKPEGKHIYQFQPNIAGFPGRHPNLELCGKTTSASCHNETTLGLTQLREANGQYYTISGKTRINEEKWYHLAATWNNKTLDLYVDGKLDYSINPYEYGYIEPRGCSFDLCDEGIDIGGYRFITMAGNYYSNQYFSGIIDEVRVWKVGRTAEQIVDNMNRVLSGAEPGLLYYWPFDEGSGTLVKSLAQDSYGSRGGGITYAEPEWVISDAPLTNDNPVKKQPSFNPSIYYTAAFVSVLFLTIGFIFGICGARYFSKKSSPDYSRVTTNDEEL